MRKKATLICDLQFGSTGKGLIAGYLAEKERPDVLVTAWSANAGHTYIDANDKKYIHCMLANGIVASSVKTVLIGPGSQIRIGTLIDEIIANHHELKDVDIFVHENSCVIQDWHVAEEQGPMTKIGSTKKGCGAALIDKIRRNPDKVTTIGQGWQIKDLQEEWSKYFEVISHSDYLQVLHEADHIQVEGAQGYSLGINSGFYPYVTSRECATAQILSDTLLPIKMLDRVVGSCRTFPIRVANRFDENGNQVGWSGPFYKDQVEIDWKKDLGIKAELTTVTKLPRRIFTFSMLQLEQAIMASGVDDIFLNFANYMSENEYLALVKDIDAMAADYGARISYIGHGATIRDVEEVQ